MASVDVVFDSSVLIDFIAFQPGAHGLMDSMSDSPWCSEISRVEVLRGVEDIDRPMAEALFESIRWLPINEAVAREAGELGRLWGRRRAGISAADLVVAATALSLGARLATRNVRHFPMFPDLEPPY